MTNTNNIIYVINNVGNKNEYNKKEKSTSATIFLCKQDLKYKYDEIKWLYPFNGVVCLKL